jgi:hypothetical protein
MSIFGTTIELNMAEVSKQTSLDERLANQVLKRHKERSVFLSFLRSDFNGKTIFEHMHDKAKEQDGSNISSQEVAEFVLAELKIQTNGLTSPYKALVNAQINIMEPTMRSAQEMLAKGKIDPKEMPKGYPTLHKLAEGLVVEKVKSSLKDTDKSSLAQRKSLLTQIKIMSRELIFAINKLGLEESDLVKYLCVLFEISEIEVADQIKPNDLRRFIAESIKDNTELHLVHIKCLRFVYPQEGGVQILKDTKDVVIDGVQGRYSPKSEENLFPRLIAFTRRLDKYGIKVRFTVCLADNDLDLLFPQGNNYVGKESLDKARQNLKTYLNHLKQVFGEHFSFIGLTDLSEKTQGKYDSLYGQVIRDLNQMGGKFIDPNFFERDRVNHQYEYYQRLFGVGYSRQEARRSIIAQSAATIALQESLRVLGEQLILIEENRGGENKFIANSAFPIIFVKLRDEAKFNIEDKNE